MIQRAILGYLLEMLLAVQASNASETSCDAQQERKLIWGNVSLLELKKEIDCTDMCHVKLFFYVAFKSSIETFNEEFIGHYRVAFTGKNMVLCVNAHCRNFTKFKFIKL